MFEKAVTCSGGQCRHRAKGEAYTPEQVKALLGVSTSTVYGMLRANLFPHTFTDGGIEISKPGFDLWCEALSRDIDECHGCG